VNRRVRCAGRRGGALACTVSRRDVEPGGDASPALLRIGGSGQGRNHPWRIRMGTIHRRREPALYLGLCSCQGRIQSTRWPSYRASDLPRPRDLAEDLRGYITLAGVKRAELFMRPLCTFASRSAATTVAWMGVRGDSASFLRPSLPTIPDSTTPASAVHQLSRRQGAHRSRRRIPSFDVTRRRQSEQRWCKSRPCRRPQGKEDVADSIHKLKKYHGRSSLAMSDASC